MANIDISALEKDPRLFLYTSLTAGSSHIITATSRLETILKANKIPFQAIDLATDERARRLWQRRSQGKKLPGLVKDGYVLGDLEEIEEWNEFGELRENIGPVPASDAAVPPGGLVGVNVAPPIAVNHPFTGQHGASSIAPRAFPVPGESAQRIALPGAAEIAAMAKARLEAVGAKAKEVEQVKEPEKKDVEDGAKEVVMESRTGVSSTAPTLTTAAGETAKPIKDADLDIKDAVEEEVKKKGKNADQETEDKTGVVAAGEQRKEDQDVDLESQSVTRSGVDEDEKKTEGQVGAAREDDDDDEDDEDEDEDEDEDDEEDEDEDEEEKLKDKEAAVKKADDIEPHAEPEVQVKSQTGETSMGAEITTAAIKDADVEVITPSKALDKDEGDTPSTTDHKAENETANDTKSYAPPSEADEPEVSSKQNEVKGVDGLRISDDRKPAHTQEQAAKAPELAAESVED